MATLTLTKSANKSIITEEQNVVFTYTLTSADGGSYLTKITDSVFGVVWTGNLFIASFQQIQVTKFVSATQTNNATADYGDGAEYPYGQSISNEVTVTLSPWKDIAQAVNTKEDVEILNGLMQGNRAWEEAHALRCVKMSKVIDLI